MLVEGDFTSVGGQPRQQIFMIDLGSGSATLDSWHPSIFNDNCSVKEPFYLQDAAWAPGAFAGTIYAVGTGLHLANWNGTFPLTGLCDAVTAVSATSGAMQWQNFTGCDSLFSVATDSTTVYIGGHERWANNENGCNHAGAGAVKAQGMAGFDITEGATLRTNGSGTPGCTPGPAASAPTTCCGPAPVCGSPATMRRTSTSAKASPGTLDCASCPVPDRPGLRGHAAPRPVSTTGRGTASYL